MIINGQSIQFNYKNAGYKSIDEVPYWRVYIIKRQKSAMKLPDGTTYRCTANQIVYRYRFNYPMEEIKRMTFNLNKGEYLVAYARKRMTNYKI